MWTCTACWRLECDVWTCAACWSVDREDVLAVESGTLECGPVESVAAVLREDVLQCCARTDIGGKICCSVARGRTKEG